MKYFIPSFSPFNDSIYKQMYVHEVLANPLVKLYPEKCD